MLPKKHIQAVKVSYSSHVVIHERHECQVPVISYARWLGFEVDAFWDWSKD